MKLRDVKLKLSDRYYRLHLGSLPDWAEDIDWCLCPEGPDKTGLFALVTYSYWRVPSMADGYDVGICIVSDGKIVWSCDNFRVRHSLVSRTLFGSSGSIGKIWFTSDE